MTVEQQPDKARLLLHEAIAIRHSTRLFLPKPLPDATLKEDDTLKEALRLARLSPS